MGRIDDGLVKAFAPETLEEYIREDLGALEHPHREDQAVILQDLRFLFREYGRQAKRQDWSPV